jgi:Flp pilus assembly secretin CpaC
MILRALFAAVLAAGLAAAALANSHTVKVPVDHAGLVRLPEAAAGVVVGNPDIADATLYDARTLLISAKVYGRTNLIAMNDAGQVIYTADIAVTQNERSLVQVFRNTARASLVCDPVCQVVALPGDAGVEAE